MGLQKLAGFWKLPIKGMGGVRKPPACRAGRSLFPLWADGPGCPGLAGLRAPRDHERVEREPGAVAARFPVISMNFKRKHSLPTQLEDDAGLPRNREERLLWIRLKVQEGYYDDAHVIRAVADAFLEPNEARRAGDRS